MRARFTPASLRDLIGITAYIARDNPARARSYAKELRDACRRIAENPLAAAQRSDLDSQTRSRPYGSYTIYFTPEPGGALIVRILHGAQDEHEILRPNDDSAAPRHE